MEISKSSTSGVKKKARVTQACDQCIRARRGCTGELPCKLCFERKKKCSYTKVPKKRGPPVGYIQTKRENAAEENELNIPVEEATEIISASAQTLLIDTLARIPVNLQPTQLSPLEVVSSRPRDITQWNFVTFATILFLNEDQSVSGLFEFYFRWVFPKLPIFSKNWLAKNMAHIPLPLFHAIYACCLCFPLKQPPSHQVANTHYRYASSAVYNNLEQSDGWTVAILIHLAFYALDRITPFAANAHAAAGMSLAEIFGFHLDLSFPFPSMSSSLALNTCRSMWYILYQWDFNSYFLFNVDLKISSMVLIDSLETYVMPNQNDSSNIQENALTFCRYSLPQINFAKSIIYALKDRDFSMESRFLLLTGMDNWFALLPGNLRVRDDDFQWIGIAFLM